MDGLKRHPLFPNEELNCLAAFLDSVGPAAMSVSALDGFITGLVCCPQVIPPRDYLSHIWGDDYVFDCVEDAQRVITMIMLRWNAIASNLHRSLYEPMALYVPEVLDEVSASHRGIDWARGFMHALKINPAGWDKLVDVQGNSGLIFPMAMLDRQQGLALLHRGARTAAEYRRILVHSMIASVNQIYRHFEAQRRGSITLTGNQLASDKRGDVESDDLRVDMRMEQQPDGVRTIVVH
jgi:uncharacterized protein